MKKKLTKIVLSFLMAFSLLFTATSCGGNKELTEETSIEQAKKNIEKSGLAVDVEMKTTLGGIDCSVLLNAETGTFEAYETSSVNASFRAFSGKLIFKGSFFYGADLWLKVEVQVADDGTETTPEKQYYSVSVDFSKINEAVLNSDGSVDYTSVVYEQKGEATEQTAEEYEAAENSFTNPDADEPETTPTDEPETPSAEEPETPPETPPAEDPSNTPEDPPANEPENPPAQEPETDPNNPLAGHKYVRYSPSAFIGNVDAANSWLNAFSFNKDFTGYFYAKNYPEEKIYKEKIEYKIDVEKKSYSWRYLEYVFDDSITFHSKEDAKAYEDTLEEGNLEKENQVYQKLFDFEDYTYEYKSNCLQLKNTEGEITDCLYEISSDALPFENKIYKSNDQTAFASNGYGIFYFALFKPVNSYYLYSTDNNEFVLQYDPNEYYNNYNTPPSYISEEKWYSTQFLFDYTVDASKKWTLTSKIKKSQKLSDLFLCGGITAFMSTDGENTLSINPFSGDIFFKVGKDKTELKIEFNPETFEQTKPFALTEKNIAPAKTYSYTYSEIITGGNITGIKITATGEDKIFGEDEITLDYIPVTFTMAPIFDYLEFFK